MKNEKTIKVLNSLIIINNDRIQGYDTASKETDEQDLKTLFTQLSQTSQKCKQELVSEVNKLGGTPDEGTKTSGKFFRVWMDVKASITGKDRKAILNSCEFGEDVAVDTYTKVLRVNLDDLTTEQLKMINAQHALIKADHDKIKYLRDMFIEQN